jgi:hypothetical protein
MKKKAYGYHCYSKADCNVEGQTLAEMADGLREVADWLDELYVEGVEIADGTTDDHRWFTTTDPAVADKYGFEEDDSLQFGTNLLTGRSPPAAPPTRRSWLLDS